MVNTKGLLTVNKTSLQLEKSETLKEELKKQTARQEKYGDVIVNLCFTEGETLSHLLINYFKMLKNK